MTDALAARLAEVRRRILGRARETLEEALALLDAADRDVLAQAERDRVYIMIHNLAGSCGSVGLQDVSAAAKALDKTVSGWLRAGEARPQWKLAFQDLALAMAEAQRKETSNA